MAYMFVKDTNKLFVLHELLRRMHANNYQRPTPPPSATLTGKGLNNAVRLQWNSVSEQATDIIVPDSLGKPFKGYRLLRAQRKEGPYVEIGKWTTDSVLVHEFTDQGSDIGGLRNNVRYYYQLLSFDAGAPMLDLDPMETAPTEGVNSISVVPTTEPSNIAASTGSGTLSDGTLGNISALQLLPTNAGNYASFFSNRNFTMEMTTTSDGKEYFFPVTIKDTISGRSQNIVITPNLKVHGSSSTAGIKEGKGFIPNLFGLGGADVEFQYRYEQLADSFR
ncbi:MAG: hypothetical protein HUU02_16790, partial [Bacteroidetes bacterium]|nr:hypothetical protein [Bacteroidota bacterium]